MAVLLCDNVEGNELLRQMENAAHNEWKPQNYRDGDQESINLVYRAHSELQKFVNDKLESLSKVDASKKINFIGLEEYLSIPEDLLEKDEEYGLQGENSNNISGAISKDLSVDETGMQTTKYEPINIRPAIKEHSQIQEENNVDTNSDGSERFTTGGNNEGEGGNMPGINAGPKIKLGEQSNNPSESGVLVKVRLKVAAQFQDGLLYHNLIISSDKNIPNAIIELFVASDNDRDDGVEIIMCDNGKAQNNKLKDVSLSAGKNKIKIRFADKLKHSIKIKAYELR